MPLGLWTGMPGGPAALLEPDFRLQLGGVARSALLPVGAPILSIIAAINQGADLSSLNTAINTLENAQSMYVLTPLRDLLAANLDPTRGGSLQKISRAIDSR
jgi:hypothetical protein